MPVGCGTFPKPDSWQDFDSFHCGRKRHPKTFRLMHAKFVYLIPLQPTEASRHLRKAQESFNKHKSDISFKVWK